MRVELAVASLPLPTHTHTHTETRRYSCMRQHTLKDQMLLKITWQSTVPYFYHPFVTPRPPPRPRQAVEILSVTDGKTGCQLARALPLTRTDLFKL